MVALVSKCLGCYIKTVVLSDTYLEVYGASLSS